MDITVIIAFACVLVLGYALGTLLQKNRESQEQVRELLKRVHDLEAANQKRMSWKTAEAIENATAALIAAQNDVKFNSDLLDNAAAWLRRARNPDGASD